MALPNFVIRLALLAITIFVVGFLVFLQSGDHSTISMLCARASTPSSSNFVDSLKPINQQRLIDGSFLEPVGELEDKISLKAVAFGEARFYALDNGMIDWVFGSSTEKSIHSVMTSVFSSKCKEGAPVLDIGSNTGIYGLYAAKMGCDVYLFDLQPACHRAVQAAINQNRFERAWVVPHGVSNVLGNIPVPTNALCDGRFPQTVLEGQYKSSPTWINISTLALDDIINASTLVEPIVLIKIDTEGNELRVLMSMLNLLSQGHVQNVVVETTAFWWGGRGFNIPQGVEIFEKIWDFGYTKMTVLNPHLELTDKSMIGSFLEKSNRESIQADIWVRK